jgi:hypothetical protein
LQHSIPNEKMKNPRSFALTIARLETLETPAQELAKAAEAAESAEK